MAASALGNRKFVSIEDLDYIVLGETQGLLVLYYIGQLFHRDSFFF